MGVAKAFVGRNRELEELQSAFDEVRGGRGALFLLVGGAGIGKTRLADEAARAAEAAGLQAFWGRCWETGGAPAYWPWIQVLRELAADRNVAELGAAAGSAAPMLAQLVPELASPDKSAPGQPPESFAAESRFRLFDAVSAVLRAAARKKPLFVVLDDLHTADPSSLALLHFVARNLRGVRALLVGTYRDEEARASAELGRTLADIAREGTYLPLGPLGSEDIAVLVTRLSGKPADAALVESVQRTTEGNPLFLDELLRLLMQRGELGGAATGLGTLPVPETVRDVIRRRLMRLPAPTRELLTVASVLGRDFTSATLAELVAQPAAKLEVDLGEVERTNLLLALGPGSYRFSHVLVCETLYRDLPADRRRELHLEAAARLEALGGEDVLSEIAHHRLAALPMGDVSAAMSAARRAADRAMAMLAFEDAAALLEQAHHDLQGTRDRDPRLSCELRLTAGLARMRGGDTEGRGQSLCVAAAEEARRLGDGELFARAALGYGAEVMLARTDPTLVRLLEESLNVLPPGPSGLRAQVMARLAAARQPAPDPSGPIAEAREAVAMARAAQSPEILRGVLYFAGSAMAEYADPAERAHVSAELVTMARAADDRVQVLRGESRLVFDYLEMGELDRCQRALDGYEEVAQAFRQPRHLWPGRLMRAMVSAALGRFADADRLTQEARALAVNDGETMTKPCLAWHRVGHVLTLEKVEDLDDAMAEIEAEMGIIPPEGIADGIISMSKAVLLARLSDDREEVTRLLDLMTPHIQFLRHEYGSVATVADAVAFAGHQSLARALYDILVVGTDRVGTHGRSGFYCGGPLEGGLGLLAGTLGRLDEAIERLERAVSRARTLGLRPFAGQMRWWQARFVIERGAAGAAAEARELLSEAEVVGRSLRLRRLQQKVAALQAEIEHPSATIAAAPAASAPTASADSAPPRARSPLVTLVREGDYWTFTADHETTRLRDTRGVQMLAELLQHPGREFHALALMGSDTESVDGGDAGELLDEEAIADYRRRLEVLDDELGEAERWGDAGRATRATAEREAIAEELSRGVGLGGRSRRAGSAAERARVNVQRRIRGAIRKIAETMPTTAAYLDRAVRTGAFCSFEPF